MDFDIVKAEPDILSPHTIYIVLTRMVGEGLISSRLEEQHEQIKPGRPRRRLYRLEQSGRRKLYLSSGDTREDSNGILKPA